MTSERNSTPYDLDTIREKITIPQVLALFSFEWDGKSNIRCPFHDDNSPSMSIYDDHGFCHACKKYADIFSITMRLGKMNFSRAIEWLLDKKGILPETTIRRQPIEYLGPLPIEMARYYRDQLDEERRTYLYSRLFTDDTLDRYMIGYRPDYQAYTIPFWEGCPGKSNITSLQYRIAPWAENQNKKYWWESGRYKACVFNAHLINTELVVLVFGTLDALLGGGQDGLPMISASGLNTFSQKDKPESLWLKQALSGTKRKLIVPDKTPTEIEPALRVSNLVGGQLNFFNIDIEEKDYSEYRLKHTAKDFCELVLEESVELIMGESNAAYF